MNGTIGESTGRGRRAAWTAIALATTAGLAWSPSAPAQTWSQAAQARVEKEARTQHPPPGRAAMVFAAAVPAATKWATNPAVPGAASAVLLGDPSKPEPYVVRLKFPADYRMMPHTHPDDRVYTVLSGHIRVGLGEQFDEAGLEDFPAGTVYHLPAKAPHFQATRGETVLQYTATGPGGVAFVDPQHDPRKE